MKKADMKIKLSLYMDVFQNIAKITNKKSIVKSAKIQKEIDRINNFNQL